MPEENIPLAPIAEREFRSLHASAPRAIAAGKVTREAAEAKLKAWLAIACRLGAKLPVLEAGLAWYREAHPADSEMMSRALYADDICPRARWAPILAEARDQAIDHFARIEAAGTRGPDLARADTRAGELDALADHFAFDINGRHHIAPYCAPERREQARAAA